MTAKLTVFTSPSAFPNPQRLRLFQYEKGINQHINEVIYDMAPGGDQRKWPHLKMNPWGETPTMQLEDGSFMSESVAISMYLDNLFEGRKLFGETPKEQGVVSMWDSRIWVQILYRITTYFHVQLQGLGPKIELTNNPQWGEHCRKEALSHAGMVNQHLSDGREWLIGGKEPTFADITLCTAIAFSKFGPVQMPLDERFEHLHHFWQRWQTRDSFKQAYADGAGLPELAHLIKK